MRHDMNRVIIEPTRCHCESDSIRVGSEIFELYEDGEEVVRMRSAPRRKGKHQNDRLKPLLDFLEKRCGHSWSKVWQEICAVNDRRSIKGYHLRDHVQQLVIGKGMFPWRRPFHIDKAGILRKNPVFRTLGVTAATYKVGPLQSHL